MRRPSDEAQIHPAGLLDAPLIAAMQNTCFPDQQWSQKAVQSLMQHSGAIAWIATGRAFGETMPQGYVLARLATDELEIQSLAVLEEARGQRLGTELLEAAIDRARPGGARRVHLEVAADNMAALHIYARAGFTETGRRPGYYQRRDGSSVEAVCLAREL